MDVQIWIYHCLLENGAQLGETEAWELARKVIGDGEVALLFHKEEWERQVPGWGVVIHICLQHSQRYVVRRRSIVIESLFDLSHLDGLNLRIPPSRSDVVVPRGWKRRISSNRQKRRILTNENGRNRPLFLPTHHDFVEQTDSRQQGFHAIVQVQTKRGSALVGRLRRQPSIMNTMAARNGFIFDTMQVKGMPMKAAKPKKLIREVSFYHLPPQLLSSANPMRKPSYLKTSGE